MKTENEIRKMAGRVFNLFTSKGKNKLKREHDRYLIIQTLLWVYEEDKDGSRQKQLEERILSLDDNFKEKI